jgi:hypothetical protein
MLYATWISIGTLLISLAHLLQGKRKSSIAWLSIGASIHPAMALCLALIMLAFLVTNADLKVYTRIKLLLFFLFPPTFFSIVSFFIGKTSSAKNIPPGWFEDTRKVMHWYAWKLNPKLETFQTTVYTLMFTFFILFLINSKSLVFPKKIIIFYNSVVAIFLVTYLVQAFAFTLNIREIYSISFGRFSIFSSIIAVIIMAHTLKLACSTRENETKFRFGLILITSLVPSFFNLALSALILAAKDNFSHLTKAVKIVKIISLSLIPIVTLELWRAISNKSWIKGEIFPEILKGFREVPNHLSIKMFENISILLWVPILIVLFLVPLLDLKTRIRATSVLLIFLALISLGGRYILSNRRDVSHSDWIQIQVWANENSKVGSKFIVDSGFDVYESWTTLSRRPRMISNLSAGFLYFYTKEDQEYDRLRSKISPTPSNLSSSDILFDFYKKFSKTVGGDYLVWKNSYTKLPLPTVFKNSEFIIYKIQNS